MAPWNEDNLPDELRDVARRLREERREATPLELDRIKMTAMSRARARSSAPRGRVRTRVVVALTSLALVGGATGGVIAAGNGGKSKDDNAAKKQYQPGKGCGDKNHDHAREDECKKDNDGDGKGGH